MASPTDIRKGRVIMYQSQPHLVLAMQHRTQGRQAGFIQLTMRNLNSGASTNTKFRSTDNVDFCHMETRELEFSYVDEVGCHFMNPETFEDDILPDAILENQKPFLVENNTYDVLFVDDKAVQVQLPTAVEMKVTEAPEAVRGDTAANVQKPVITENGLVVQVPLFIKEGEIIRVSTTDKSYLGRA